MKAKACKAKGKHSNSSKRGTKIAARGGAEGMEIVNPHAGGIDCGAQEHYVAVPPQSVEPGEPVVRCFSAFTEGLDALVEWLKACGVTTVAIESNGGLLDSTLPEAGSCRHRGVSGQCPARTPRSRTQD